jgi:hypothetical protein
LPLRVAVHQAPGLPPALLVSYLQHTLDAEELPALRAAMRLYPITSGVQHIYLRNLAHPDPDAADGASCYVCDADGQIQGYTPVSLRTFRERYEPQPIVAGGVYTHGWRPWYAWSPVFQLRAETWEHPGRPCPRILVATIDQPLSVLTNAPQLAYDLMREDAAGMALSPHARVIIGSLCPQPGLPEDTVRVLDIHSQGGPAFETRVHAADQIQHLERRLGLTLG